MKAIVVGAGVVGSAVAFRLAEAGAKVLLIDALRVGGDASAASYAWLNASNKPPRVYHDLNVAGMQAHAALQDEFGETPWYHPTGAIAWAASEADRAALRTRSDALAAWGYPTEFISRAEARALEPDLDLDRFDDLLVNFAVQEGWIDAVTYADAMVRRACASGAVVQGGLRVVDIVVRAGAARGVRTSDGALHEADVVVNCAGRWADRLGEDPELWIPLAPTIGFLAFTPPVATSIARPIRNPGVQFRPDGGGRLMMRAGDLDRQVTLETAPGPTLAPALEAMRRVAALVPALQGVLPEAARITARPIPRDGLPAVGPVPRVANYFLVVSHSGVTLSPLLARMAADEIVHGTIHRELDDFRPGRFFN